MTSYGKRMNVVSQTTIPYGRVFGIGSIIIIIIALGFSVIVLDALSSPTPNLSSKKSHLLVLGLGRVGQEIAQLGLVELQLLDSVVGTVRPEKFVSLKQNNDYDDYHSFSKKGIQFIPLETNCIRKVLVNTGNDDDPLFTHVLITIPPPDDGRRDENLEDTFAELEKTLLPGTWVGLLSTTAVYGNHNGAIVTEESECNTVMGNTTAVVATAASRFLRHELEWHERARRAGLQLRIFRCAGIYGPGRSALHTVFRKGWTQNGPRNSRSTDDGGGDDSKQTTVFGPNVTNRIHSKDLARAVLGSMQMHQASSSTQDYPTCRVYNLADSLPEARHVVIQFAVQLLEQAGIRSNDEHPQQHQQSTLLSSEQRPGASRARRRDTDQKRVCNRRMLNELLSEKGLLFPTYKEGLEAILKCPTSPWWTKDSVRDTSYNAS
jgi:nucleoside-diphosphate-sugar epimerase